MMMKTTMVVISCTLHIGYSCRIPEWEEFLPASTTLTTWLMCGECGENLTSRGVRFKCFTCSNLDLCYDCHVAGKHVKKTGHEMIEWHVGLQLFRLLVGYCTINYQTVVIRMSLVQTTTVLYVPNSLARP